MVGLEQLILEMNLLKKIIIIFLFLFLLSCSNEVVTTSTVNIKIVWHWDSIEIYMKNDLCWLGWDTIMNKNIIWESIQDNNIGNRPWGYDYYSGNYGFCEMSPEWWKRVDINGL